MSRDDELAVIQCKDGKWIIAHVCAERYDLVKTDVGQYNDLKDALYEAHKADKKCWGGGTEYGIQVHYFNA